MDQVTANWTELLSAEDSIRTVKKLLEEKFKEYYSYFYKNGKLYFNLPHDTTMELVILRWATESSIVMSYESPGDNDDGDQFFPTDFKTLDDMFAAMLKETML